MKKRVSKLIALLLGAVMLVPAPAATVFAAEADGVEAAKEELVLPYNTTDKQVYGNITLPTTVGEEVSVTWTTSHPQIVDVEAHDNEGYDATPAGTVTRPARDTDVTMTATLELDGETATKEFTFTVKAAPAEVSEEEYTDYFFAYFAGEGYSDGEQVYFAASQDGLNWSDLNENKPVLISSLGEQGVRDPYVIRSAEGDKFYMIATDLKINGGKGWGAAQTAGSQSIMVWESTDLVNWSEQRMVPISASIDSGCTWAPECYYDDITGEYIVFWASKVKADGYSKQRLYYAKTRDFYSFTEPEVFIDYDESSIDTTIMYDEETEMYYRYTKNEGGATNELNAKTKTVFAEKSATLLGEWTHIPSDTLNKNQGVEGPAIFKFNQDDSANGDYCLLVDNYGAGGYYPLVTDDIASAVYNRPSAGYKMPSRARHGTPIPVTTEEYHRLLAAWGSDDYFDTYLLEKAIEDARTLDAANYTEKSLKNLESELKYIELEIPYLETMDEVFLLIEEVEEALDDLVALEEIKLTAPTKTIYSFGEELDLTGMTVTAVYEDGSEKTVAEGYDVMGYDSMAEGKQLITVCYGYAEAVFEVTVEKNSDVGITFTDVPKDEWFYDAVEYNYFAGTMTGVNKDEFKPNEPIVRGQFASIIHRLAGEEEVAFTPEFPDVLESDWYAVPVLWAKANKIVNGYSDGTFGPNNNIVRQEIAIMLHNYATAKGYDISASEELENFGDADQVDSWAAPAMKWAVASGIINGTKEGNLAPLATASRAECAAMIMNFMEKYAE